MFGSRRIVFGRRDSRFRAYRVTRASEKRLAGVLSDLHALGALEQMRPAPGWLATYYRVHDVKPKRQSAL